MYGADMRRIDTIDTPDVLIVGSGAAGLVAGIRAAQSGASVVIIEKSSEIGGTSATSGGGIWIPCSNLAKGVEGHEDSEDDAFQYIRSLAASWSDDSLIRSYIRQAPAMLDWLLASAPVQYIPLPYPDYHPESAGGKTGWRTHLPLPLDLRARKAAIRNLRRASPAASLGGVINWTFDETTALLYRPKGWIKTLTGMAARYALDLPYRLTSTRDRFLTLGNALVGALVLAAREAGVALYTDTSLRALKSENGRVTGATVLHDGALIDLTARSIILAAGGWERDPALRQQYMPHLPDPTHSGSQPNNTGDAIKAAMGVGAQVRGMGAAWWAPVFRVPGEHRGRLCTIERALPGCIMVDAHGNRFMNEASSYHIAGEQMMAHAAKIGSGPRFWMVFDSRYRSLYPMGPLYPILPDGLQLPGVSGILHKAGTLTELAAKIGADRERLENTVTSFNRHAAQGQDPEFGRGESAYDRMYGDPRVTPNPTLAPLAKAPFYALPIYAGDIGTCSGLATDEHARVLNEDGQPIDGLYAAGNTAASVMGGSYPGAGSTLGPAMTFAWAAASHATR